MWFKNLFIYKKIDNVKNYIVALLDSHTADYPELR